MRFKIRDYFKKAIKDYAGGKRPSPEMEPYSNIRDLLNLLVAFLSRLK